MCIIGTIFLIVCLIRAIRGQFTPRQHLGFEFAAWYWHFVDVVWLFLFVCIYVWGSWGGAAGKALRPWLGAARVIDWRRRSAAGPSVDPVRIEGARCRMIADYPPVPAVYRARRPVPALRRAANCSRVSSRWRRRCDVCGLDFTFADSGDGPAVFVTSSPAPVVVGLALFLDVPYEPPIWVHRL